MSGLLVGTTIMKYLGLFGAFVAIFAVLAVLFLIEFGDCAGEIPEDEEIH